MVKKKKSIIFPDTGTFAVVPYQGVSSDAQNQSLAESTEENGPNSTINGSVISLIVAPRVHPVLFEVSKNGNAVTFLINLLTNLKRVDRHARLLPKPDASENAMPLSDVSDIPKGESAKIFVIDYLDDLHVTAKFLKGKFWVQCKAKFPTFKKNTTFFKWLAGSKSEPKITLVRTELQGPKRYTVGFFLNVVARYDLADLFTEQVKTMLAFGTQTGPSAPSFQFEPFIMYRNKQKTKVYALYASSPEDAEALTNIMVKVFPNPAPEKLTFIPVKLWNVLDSEKKTAYFEMQRDYSESHNAIRFQGIIDGNIVLPLASRTNRGNLTIIQWMAQLQTKSGFPLFVKVSQCHHGEIELWHHVSQTNAAKAWLSTALAGIARLSRIDFLSERGAAEAMFKHPSKVWASMETLKNVGSLTAQRDKFMDFTPPMKSTSTVASGTTQTKKRAKKPASKALRLSFTTDDQDSVSVLSEEMEAKRKAPKRSAKQRAGAHSAAIDSNDAALKASRKACYDATKLMEKYPPHVRNPGGDYFTIPDKYGYPIPIVYIDGKTYPMTKENLLQSRQTKPPPAAATQLEAVTPPAVATPPAAATTQHRSYGKNWQQIVNYNPIPLRPSEGGPSLSDENSGQSENTSVASRSTHDSLVSHSSAGAGSMVSFSQIVDCRPFIKGLPSQECNNLQVTALAVRPAKITKGCQVASLKYSSRSSTKHVVPILIPRNQEKLVALRKKNEKRAGHRQRDDAEQEYIDKLERDCSSSYREIDDLRRTVEELRNMVQVMSRQKETYEVQKSSSFPAERVEPPPSEDVDMTAADEEFSTVHGPRRTHHKMSSLAAASATYRGPEVKHQSQPSPDTYYNPFSSLGQAASESGEEQSGDDADLIYYSSSSDDDMSVVQTTDQVRHLSIKNKSKPGAPPSEDGTGRKE